MKLLEETRIIFFYFELGNSFLNMTSKAQARKERLCKLDINLAFGNLVITKLGKCKLGITQLKNEQKIY